VSGIGQDFSSDRGGLFKHHTITRDRDAEGPKVPCPPMNVTLPRPLSCLVSPPDPDRETQR